MKIKTLLSLAIAFFAIVFIACDDDLNSVGNSIQPDGDGIFVGADTVIIKAETISFKDSVYAHTVYGLLGEYVDPIFGKIKSDYLSEFYCPTDAESTLFKDNVKSIDSVFLDTEFTYFTGDSISPMGLSVYEVTSPLKAFFFTSIDPTKYCDMKKVLGQSIFSIQDVPDTVISKTRIRTIKTKLDIALGERFYKKWKDTNGEAFKNSDELKKFFKGVYVTTTFGSGSLINVDYTELNIKYTYNIRNKANTADSAAVGIFRLPVTPEVIQMNHVKNDIPSNLFLDKDTKTYMTTPAGLYTQISIPLDQIRKKAGTGRVINAANFKIKGFTEEEEKSNLLRPTSLLLINKDSLKNFFFEKKLQDNRTSFIISRNAKTNSYDFGNIASIINHYADHYKNMETLPDLNYVIIPVMTTTFKNSNNVTVISDIYNQMFPTSAILRSDPKNMKMSIIFTQYNDNTK